MRTAALFLSLLSLAACAEEETGYVADALPDEAAPESQKAVAVVEYGASTLSFYVSDDHQVGVVAELSDEGVLPFIDTLAEVNPTPLEVFGLVSDDEPPLALVEHHLAVAPDLGLDDEPRGHEDLVFTGMADPFVSDSLYAADCGSADKDWHVDRKETYEADWSMYWNVTSSSIKTFTTSSTKSLFLSHLCNKARSGTVYHTTSASGTSAYITQVVPIGQRSSMIGLGDATWSTIQRTAGGSGRYRLGALARE